MRESYGDLINLFRERIANEAYCPQQWEDDPPEESSLKSYCAFEFDYLVDGIRIFRQHQLISDKDVFLLYKTVLAHYLGCLIETEVENKMVDWSRRFFGS